MIEQPDRIVVNPEGYAWLQTTDERGRIRASFIGKRKPEELRFFALARGIVMDEVTPCNSEAFARRNARQCPGGPLA